MGNLSVRGRVYVLAPPSRSEKGRGTGTEFAIALRDAGVDRGGEIELGHISAFWFTLTSKGNAYDTENFK